MTTHHLVVVIHQVCYFHYVGFLLQYTATAVSGAASKQPKQSSLLHTTEKVKQTMAETCVCLTHQSIRIVRVEFQHLWIFSRRQQSP